jgi:hypothetical protein
MDIHKLGRDDKVRRLYDCYGDECAYSQEEYLATISWTQDKRIACQRCGVGKILRRVYSYEHMGIVKIAYNPRKYITEDEILVCGVCARKSKSIYIYKLYHHFLEKPSITPRFTRVYVSGVVSNFYIYNKKYNYYMDVILTPQATNDFAIRASNFKKYDPYRVGYITLFDLILLKYEI